MSARTTDCQTNKMSLLSLLSTLAMEKKQKMLQIQHTRNHNNYQIGGRVNKTYKKKSKKHSRYYSIKFKFAIPELSVNLSIACPPAKRTTQISADHERRNRCRSVPVFPSPLPYSRRQDPQLEQSLFGA